MTPSPLALPGVAAYVGGRFVSALGRSMLSVALGWQLYERTHSAFALGLVGLVQVVPVVGLVVVAGATADRFPRKTVGALSFLVQALVAVGLALVSATAAPVGVIYGLLFVAGTASAFAGPAVSVLLPALAPTELLARANAWSSMSFHLAMTLGPAAAGFYLDATHDATPIYWACAVTAAAFAIILLCLPIARGAVPERRALRSRDLLAGLRFVFRCKELLGAITLDLFAVLLGGVTALMPVFAKDVLAVGPRGLGWLQAAPAIGAFLGGVVQTRLPAWKRAGHVLLLSVAGFGACTLGFGFSRSLPLSLVLLFTGGVFDSLSVVIRRTLEQVVTPDRLRGRVAAVHYVFIGLSNELGEFESGTTAALLGPIGSVLLGGVGTLAVVLFARVRWPIIAQLGRLDRIRPREDLALAIEGPPADLPAPTSGG